MWSLIITICSTCESLKFKLLSKREASCWFRLGSLAKCEKSFALEPPCRVVISLPAIPKKEVRSRLIDSYPVLCIIWSSSVWVHGSPTTEKWLKSYNFNFIQLKRMWSGWMPTTRAEHNCSWKGGDRGELCCLQPRNSRVNIRGSEEKRQLSLIKRNLIYSIRQ